MAGTHDAAARRSRAGAYGSDLAEAFRLEAAPAFVNRNLKAGLLAVTEVRDDAPALGISNPIPVEDAFLATLHLANIRNHTAWEAGRQYPVRTIGRGETLVRDLKRDPSVLVDQAHHELHFYVPRAALDQIADDCEARRIDDLRYDPGVSLADPVIAGLGLSIRGAFALPHQANTLFLDHVMHAVATHLATAFGGLAPRSRPQRGGLSPWQEARAKAVMSANLGGDLQLVELAQECGVSTSHFQRAFRISTGISPHQWLLQRRIDAAKARLREGRLSLAEVALAAGFADQSHFTRVFSRFEGVSPGRWRQGAGLRAHEQDRTP